LTNGYQFTGKDFDAEANLYYFNARWNDSDIGRFISEDPLWGNILDPQSLNRFAYGKNNPHRYTDPSRIDFESEFVKGEARLAEMLSGGGDGGGGGDDSVDRIIMVQKS